MIVAGDPESAEIGRDIAIGLAETDPPWFTFDEYRHALNKEGLARHLSRSIPSTRDPDPMDLWLVATAAACEVDADIAKGRSRGIRPRAGEVWDAVLDAPDQPPILVIAARAGYANERAAEKALLACRPAKPVAPLLRSWMKAETHLIDVE